LLPRGGRVPAMVVVGAALAVFVALAVWLHGVYETGVDEHLTRWIYMHIRREWQVHLLADLTSPMFEEIVLAVVAIAAAVRRRWRIAVLAVVAPALALLVGEQVLKPLIHRPHSVANPSDNSFPSGHETGLVSMLTVLSVLLVRTAWSLAVKTAVLVVFGIWTVLGAVGLVRIFAHYPTDTLGAVCWSVAVVLSTTVLLDAVGRRRVSGPAAPDPPRTAHVA